MRIQIDKIKVNPGRREAMPEYITELAKSIAEVGLLNPITVDRDYTLIAGLHRLEATRSLGWTEIECTVSSLEGLQAELAEIDENFVRHDLSAVEFGDLLLRRKEIYEALHPETKAGLSQAAGMNWAIGNNVAAKMAATLKPFVEDTSEKLGIAPRTIRRQIQTAKNLSDEAKTLIRHTNISKENALRLSRLAPEQQEEAASLIVSGKIKSVDEYLAGQDTRDPQTEQTVPSVSEQSAAPQPSSQATDPGRQSESDADLHIEDKKRNKRTMKPPKQKSAKAEKKEAPTQPDKKVSLPPSVSEVSDAPYSLGGVKYASIKESVADLKNPNKDCRSTPDSFLAEITEFVRKFQQEIGWFLIANYEPVFPVLTQIQFEYFRRQMNEIHGAAKQLFHHVQKGRDTHGQ